MRDRKSLRLAVNVSGADRDDAGAGTRLVPQEREELFSDTSAGLMQGGSVGTDLHAVLQRELSEFNGGVKLTVLIQCDLLFGAAGQCGPASHNNTAYIIAEIQKLSISGDTPVTDAGREKALKRGREDQIDIHRKTKVKCLHPHKRFAFVFSMCEIIE